MPSPFNKKVYLLPKFSKADYYAYMKTLHNSLSFDLSDVAKYRQHVLKFFYKHGRLITLDAFGVKQSTLYDWKKVYEDSGKKLSSLIPQSTRPHQTRTMTTDWRLEVLIKTMRQDYGNFSKYKIKPFLDEYAKSIGLRSYSVNKIQKIINRRNYYFDKKIRKRKTKIKPLSQRVKRSPKPTKPGYIEMDSITLYVLNRKFYFITAIDIFTKFAWCKLTTSLSSKQARIAFEEFRDQYSHPVRVVQTDNGSEFLKEFHQYTITNKIPHELIYPRSPKVNAFIERFNRTIQDEFISRTDSLYHDVLLFKQKLVNYLNWYNLKRPHYSLGYVSPAQYLQQYQKEH